MGFFSSCDDVDLRLVSALYPEALGVPGTGERDLIETSFLGVSGPRSLTLGISSDCICLLQVEASLVMAKQGTDL